MKMMPMNGHMDMIARRSRDMLILEFLAMVLLYAVNRLTDRAVEDKLGELLFFGLMCFGGLFLFVDLIDKIKGLF
jgi:uncharacterized PurR-regulated membrane protein YhhQ (DUF165 family)